MSTGCRSARSPQRLSRSASRQLFGDDRHPQLELQPEPALPGLPLGHRLRDDPRASSAARATIRQPRLAGHGGHRQPLHGARRRHPPEHRRQPVGRCLALVHDRRGQRPVRRRGPRRRHRPRHPRQGGQRPQQRQDVRNLRPQPRPRRPQPQRRNAAQEGQQVRHVRHHHDCVVADRGHLGNSGCVDSRARAGLGGRCPALLAALSAKASGSPPAFRTSSVGRASPWPR